jgi:hypothetical protein
MPADLLAIATTVQNFVDAQVVGRKKPCHLQNCITNSTTEVSHTHAISRVILRSSHRPHDAPLPIYRIISRLTSGDQIPERSPSALGSVQPIIADNSFAVKQR